MGSRHIAPCAVPFHNVALRVGVQREGQFLPRVQHPQGFHRLEGDREDGRAPRGEFRGQLGIAAQFAQERRASALGLEDEDDRPPGDGVGERRRRGAGMIEHREIGAAIADRQFCAAAWCHRHARRLAPSAELARTARRGQ